MKRSNWFVPVILVLGLLLIAFSIWGPQAQRSLQLNQKAFAQLIEKTNVVTLRNNEMAAETSLPINSKLDALDMIRTSDHSEALIEFVGGGQFRLPAKSEVLLDIMDNGNFLVVVRSGDIVVEKFGEPVFWIRKEGQLFSASDYVMMDGSNSRLIKDGLTKVAKDQITQVEIEKEITAKRNDFFKCYGQLIQKKPQVVGQVLISFRIENQGTPTQIEVPKTDIIDQAFKDCLIEVVSRIKFRPYNGTPVTTVFPLKFE